MTGEDDSSGRAPPEPVLTYEPELPPMGIGSLVAVPLLFMAMLISVGTLVPDDYEEVGYAVGGIVMSVLVLTGVGVMLSRAQKKKDALMRRFTDGTARVLHVRDTGVRIRQHPQFEVKLEVQLPEREPYVALCLGTKRWLACLVEGEEIGVACNPDNPEEMFVLEEIA